MLYHNHALEFTTRVGDVEVFDQIFGTIDAQLLGAEIDVFFVAEVGRDPAALLRKFSGRLKRVHLKVSFSEWARRAAGAADVDGTVEAASGSRCSWRGPRWLGRRAIRFIGG
jgi:sugar phosphate isomerase/epimerase